MRGGRLVPGLHQVALGYVNAYIIEGEAGLVVVDTGLPGRMDRLADAVGAVGRDVVAVTDIVVTHCHIDHIGSLADLAARSGARVWTHSQDRHVTETGSLAGPMTGRNLVGRLMVFTGRPRAASPVPVDASLHDGEVVDLAGGLRVIHTPGHTPGHVSLLWEPGGVLVAGDAAMRLSGRITPPPVAEDHVAATRSFRRLATFQYDVMVFGHGRPVTTGAAESMREAAAEI
ncbi:MAG TPA: MBL fold metallo-hydrolase [Acidimicrobiia bacterium]|nr:MBL fold metallo-hydrolase [Acidimicrobiia bacterium]